MVPSDIGWSLLPDAGILSGLNHAPPLTCPCRSSDGYPGAFQLKVNGPDVGDAVAGISTLPDDEPVCTRLYFATSFKVGWAPAIPVTVFVAKTGLGADPFVVRMNFVFPPAGTYGQTLLPDVPPHDQSAGAAPEVLCQTHEPLVLAVTQLTFTEPVDWPYGITTLLADVESCPEGGGGLHVLGS